MMSPRTFRPDLADAVLEDRTLMAYSPFVPGFILTTGGYIALTAPPGLSANLGTLGGGAAGGGGGNMGTSFYVTGFGTSTISVGNATGFSGVGVAGGSGGAGGTVTLSTTVGSGASEGGGAGGGTSVSRNTLAQGGTTNPNMMYIGQTGSSSPAGGYAGASRSDSTPAPVQAPVPPAPPPS
ncbi:MAG: hypothetical protein P4L84_09435 [Isosphaeraceae bacterium]|nr:hypothetical protein [Isosphaeraceae bacterium]